MKIAQNIIKLPVCIQNPDSMALCLATQHCIFLHCELEKRFYDGFIIIGINHSNEVL